MFLKSITNLSTSGHFIANGTLFSGRVVGFQVGLVEEKTVKIGMEVVLRLEMGEPRRGEEFCELAEKHVSPREDPVVSL